jgi:hypothetical protein
MAEEQETKKRRTDEHRWKRARCWKRAAILSIGALVILVAVYWSYVWIASNYGSCAEDRVDKQVVVRVTESTPTTIYYEYTVGDPAVRRTCSLENLGFSSRAGDEHMLYVSTNGECARARGVGVSHCVAEAVPQGFLCLNCVALLCVGLGWLLSLT